MRPVDCLYLSQEDLSAAGGLDINRTLTTVEEVFGLWGLGEAVQPVKSATPVRATRKGTSLLLSKRMGITPRTPRLMRELLGTQAVQVWLMLRELVYRRRVFAPNTDEGAEHHGVRGQGNFWQLPSGSALRQKASVPPLSVCLEISQERSPVRAA